MPFRLVRVAERGPHRSRSAAVIVGAVFIRGKGAGAWERRRMAHNFCLSMAPNVPNSTSEIRRRGGRGIAVNAAALAAVSIAGEEMETSRILQ